MINDSIKKFMSEYDNHANLKDYISISSLCAFTRCPRKFFYSNVVRLKQYTEHPALAFGTAIHFALPAAFDGGVDAGVAAFDKVWEREGDDPVRNRALAIKIIKSYCDIHKEGRSIYSLVKIDAEFQRPDKTSEYEIPFLVDVGIDIPLFGWIDALTINNHTGEHFVLDFKTSREAGQRLADSFKINPQVLGYTFACNTSLPYDIAGCFIEIVQTAKTTQKIINIPISVDEKQIDDFLQWVRFYGSQIKQMHDQKYFPMNLSMCNSQASFGMPGYNCEFIELCSAEDWTWMKSCFKVSDEESPVSKLIKMTKEGCDVK